MAFMVPVLDYGDWYSAEDSHGETHVFPADILGDVPPFDSGDAPRECPELSTYLGDGCALWSLERATCYGARLSAPGYLDCTDWALFDSLAEALAYFRETWEVCPHSGDALPCGDAPEDSDGETLRAHVESCGECIAALDTCDCGDCFGAGAYVPPAGAPDATARAEGS